MIDGFSFSQRRLPSCYATFTYIDVNIDVVFDVDVIHTCVLKKYFFWIIKHLSQRFAFLNGLDCPDWLLAQIADISKMTTIKYKLLCSLVVSRMSTGANDDFDVSKYVNETLDEDSIRRILTATSFIIENAILSTSSLSDLILELEQLGLATEHCRILSKALESSSDLTSTLLKPMAKSPAIDRLRLDRNILVIVDTDDKSHQVVSTPIQREALKEEMARVGTVLSEMEQ
ncbi:hypothetical protein PMAYCL1PPCAC_23883 [Pristionchus mayeri]|uniref:COMM domain-containing protein n=1 Tax=Pristionchus mayeri TaxID=1317129 RepID=A0AAN5CZ76_9BILA|nr:hypothetical protein PMAYCL1PPCAC_23883 [Pristionchus mayeri]